MTGDRVQVEVWSDLTCPWCLLGSRSLQVAIEDVGPELAPEVRWRAYQLHPELPEEGLETEAFVAALGEERAAHLREQQDRLVLLGEELGIAFRFDRQRVQPSTALGHAVVAAARGEGVATEVHDALVLAFHERGADIGRADVIEHELAEALGDPPLARALVGIAADDPVLASEVDTDQRLAHELGITAVPCFVADRSIAVPGAVPSTALARLLVEAAERRVVD